MNEDSRIVTEELSLESLSFQQQWKQYAANITFIAGDLLLVYTAMEKAIAENNANEYLSSTLVIGGTLFAAGLIASYILSKPEEENLNTQNDLHIPTNHQRKYQLTPSELEEAVDYWC